MRSQIILNEFKWIDEYIQDGGDVTQLSMCHNDYQPVQLNETHEPQSNGYH